jgi:TRAP-type mannitol/chloroaromatic compound transport system permease large subunit
MVCWLFVGSAIFSAVFALLGGQRMVEQWVLSMNLTPMQFLLLSQAIIFVLGWPLEWTEIIVIFVPIFLPLLQHFQIDPMLWGVLVFVNLQAAFLSPPVAMSAFYLKGVSPPHVTINQIFAGMMPYMLIVILCMVLMYIWPGLTLWLPVRLTWKTRLRSFARIANSGRSPKTAGTAFPVAEPHGTPSGPAASARVVA